MPNPAAEAALVNIRENSSAYLLGTMAVVALVAYGLYYFGILGGVVGAFSRVVRWAIRRGFVAWELALSWASWWVLLLVALGLLVFGFLVVGPAPYLGFAVAAIVLYVGVTTCLAYMFIDIERYEVERGYKAVHNPLKGQELALHLAKYGHQVGVLLLIAATVATVGGFALLNQALYEAGDTDWFQLPNGSESISFGTTDFLAYSLLNLLRVVDFLDLARSKHILDTYYMRPARWPATVLIVAFRSFFTLVLLQQLFASIRQGRLLAETIADFWSPHEPIQQRARNALPQYGAAAIEPLLISLRSVAALTKEQRDQLPQILAAIGPSTVPALLKHLHDPHEHVRGVCAAALGYLNATEAVPAMVALTGDPNDHVRQSLAAGLGEIVAAAGRTDRTARVRRARAGRRRWFGRRAAVAPVADPLPQVVGALRDLLRDSSAAVRGQAAVELTRAGAAAEAAVPDLVTALHDDDETVRCQAAEALGTVGYKGDVALDALTSLLEDPSATVRTAVARGLGRFGPAAAVAVPRLVPLLQDRDEAVRTAAAEAISQAGPLNESATASLVKGLDSPDNVVRANTAEALGTVGAPAEEAAEALTEVLRDSNDVVRAKAAEALGKIGEAAADVAVPSLVKALRDKDSWVSALAAEALGEMGEAADEAVPALIRALAHVNAQVRANAALALGKLGADAEKARQALEWAASDDDGGVRAQAVRAIGLLGTSPRRSLDLIRESLEDPDPQVREAAVEALSNMNPDAAVVEDLLLPLLADANDPVKVQAARVLSRQGAGSPAVVAGLCQLLANDDNAWVQIHAALGLSRLGPAAVAAGPDLLRAAQTADAGVREHAMRALVMIQPPEALPAFTAGLKDPSAEVRLVASAGWVKAASVPPESAPALADALKDPEPQVRANAAHALARLDALPPAAIPLLIDCAQHPSDSVRLNATLALRKAPPAWTAETMESLLEDPSSRVRLIAAEAILETVPDHAAARRVVEAAKTDPSPRVREAAEELAAILPEPATVAGAAPATIPAVAETTGAV